MRDYLIRTHRFFIPPELLAASEVLLPRETAHQVTRVLRLRAGARVVLFCGDGTECEAVLEAVTEKSVTARVVARTAPDTELACRLHVAVAVLKGEKLDWVVQKLTELGAARISLLRTERTIVAAGGERWTSRLERFGRVSREAVEQSGRVRIPEILEPRPLEAVVGEEADALRVLLSPCAPQPLAAYLSPCPDHMLLLCGPEGGFTAAEVDLALRLGATTAGLGSRVLRAETAAIAAGALAASAGEARR